MILHSNQGVQFTSWDFVNFCKDNNVTQSMSKAGCPYDNAPMERFYNTFKSNFYNVTSFSSMAMMDKLTMNYINTDLAVNTLKIALKKENYPKAILLSNQGVQFT